MTATTRNPPRRSTRIAGQAVAQSKLPGQVVLVLQGGGALGAYQAGVYQAMSEAGVEPDWVIGTSIGALNAALIAGNAPSARLQRLQAFWRVVSHGGWPRWTSNWSRLESVLQGVPGFFGQTLRHGSTRTMNSEKMLQGITAPTRCAILWMAWSIPSN